MVSNRGVSAHLLPSMSCFRNKEHPIVKRSALSPSQPDVSTDRYAHGPMCPRTGMPTDRCVHGPIRPRTDVLTDQYAHGPMRPQIDVSTDRYVHGPIRHARTKPGVPKDRYVTHVLSPVCPRTDTSRTYYAQYAHGPIRHARTKPDVPKDRYVTHVLSPVCPRTDTPPDRCAHGPICLRTRVCPQTDVSRTY